MSTAPEPSVHERWAQFRFAVVGRLLAAPPPQGQLRAELERLAERTWKHPVSGQPAQFAVATIERWFLAARNARHDPVRALRRKRRKDAGRQDSLRAPRAASAAGPVPGASGLERATALRQSAEPRRGPAGTASGSLLLDRTALPAGARVTPPAAARRRTPHRRRTARRGAAGRA